MASPLQVLALFVLFVLLSSHSASKAQAPFGAKLEQSISWGSHVARTCSKDRCRKCNKHCPKVAEVAKVYWDCYKHRTFYYTRSNDGDVEAACKRQPCLEFLAPRGCKVIRHDENRDVLVEMQDEINSIQKELQAIEGERLNVLRRGTTNKAALEYYAKFVPEEKKCHHLFAEALKVRARNVQIHELLETVEYRSEKQETTRMKFESNDLTNQVQFWQYQNETISNAATTSPLELQNARDELQGSLEQFRENAELIGVLQASSLSQENQFGLITALKLKLRQELQIIRTTNAHIQYELLFIKEARREIYRFLTSVLRQVEKGKLRVECGGATLGTIASNILKD